MYRSRGRPATFRQLGVIAAFVATTLAVALVESPPLALDNGAPLYLLPVVVAALLGPVPAIVMAIVGFVGYDLLFVEPRFTLTVEDPREWVDLIVFLVVGLAVARLAGGQSQRAFEAERRLREAQALFTVSRTLAVAETTGAALVPIVDLLLRETGSARIVITRGIRDTVVAAAGGEGVLPGPIETVLARKPGSEPARWVRAHTGRKREASSAVETYRIAIEVEGEKLGALLAFRRRADGRPGPEETRLLSLAADQIALAWHREELASEAGQADVAKRSEAAQAALLQSVSHDLRTPLASIRATAGALADPEVHWSDAERRAAGARLDAEAARLNELVTNVLDLSRIQGGNLVPRLEPHELADLLEPALERVGWSSAVDGVSLHMPMDLPPVLVDPTLFDQAVTNVLDNAAHHAPGSTLKIEANWEGETVAVRIEDSGPGVADDELPRLFDRFYRAARARRSSRPGLGIGLSVVRAAMEAMGGTARAERAQSGGLAIVLRVPAAEPPAP